MNWNTKLETLTLTLVAALLIAAGCTENQQAASDKEYGQEFVDRHDSGVTKIAHAQAVGGASGDAILYPVHFNGPKLNSLGKAKLDLIVEHPTDQPRAVYVNLAESDPALGARHEAVAAYLHEQGLGDADFKIESGTNPGTYTRTANGIEHWKKTDTTGDEGSMTK